MLAPRTSVFVITRLGNWLPVNGTPTDDPLERFVNPLALQSSAKIPVIGSTRGTGYPRRLASNESLSAIDVPAVLSGATPEPRSPWFGRRTLELHVVSPGRIQRQPGRGRTSRHSPSGA